MAAKIWAKIIIFTRFSPAVMHLNMAENVFSGSLLDTCYKISLFLTELFVDTVYSRPNFKMTALVMRIPEEI